MRENRRRKGFCRLPPSDVGAPEKVQDLGRAREDATALRGRSAVARRKVFGSGREMADASGSDTEEDEAGKAYAPPVAASAPLSSGAAAGPGSSLAGPAASADDEAALSTARKRARDTAVEAEVLYGRAALCRDRAAAAQAAKDVAVRYAQEAEDHAESVHKAAYEVEEEAANAAKAVEEAEAAENAADAAQPAGGAAAQPKKRQKRAKPSAATWKALIADGEFGRLRVQVGETTYALKPIQEAELQKWASGDGGWDTDWLLVRAGMPFCFVANSGEKNRLLLDESDEPIADADAAEAAGGSASPFQLAATSAAARAVADAVRDKLANRKAALAEAEAKFAAAKKAKADAHAAAEAAAAAAQSDAAAADTAAREAAAAAAALKVAEERAAARERAAATAAARMALDAKTAAAATAAATASAAAAAEQAAEAAHDAALKALAVAEKALSAAAGMLTASRQAATSASTQHEAAAAELAAAEATLSQLQAVP